MIRLLPGWDRVHQVPRPVAVAPAPIVAPVDVATATSRIHVMRSVDEARDLLRLLQSVPLAAIAMDSEFGYSRDGVPLRSGKTWHDIRSQRPICFSIAALVTDGAENSVLRAVFDVRHEGVAEVLGEVLRIRVPFVFHHVKPELFSLWSLGLDPDLPNVYDTFLAAACLHLGRHHKRSVPALEIGDQIRAEVDKARAHAHLLSLRGQCEHYDLPYSFADSKDDLRERFLRLGDRPLDELLIGYSAADAEWTLRLYLAQQPDVLLAGMHAHLHQVEFPFALANARIEWNGVAVAPDRLARLRQGAKQAVSHYAQVLHRYGVDPPGSRSEFLHLMDKVGLRHLCRRSGKDSVEDEVLEAIQHQHPAVRAYRLHKRYQRLAAEEWLGGALTGADGRLHPDHGQLGAATGRNVCRRPNLAGIGKIFRPVVIAPPGRALVELDYAQIEVGVAATEHDDPDLIDAYNSGDVYAAMAQRFFVAELGGAERACTPREFKRLKPELRDRMKTFVLAVLYNIQPPAIAARFAITEAQAAAERERFLGLYPTLKRRLSESADYGAVRGFASTVSGLRRLRPSPGRPDSWTKNFLRNTPIQGSAAAVFKLALVLLDREFRRSSTLLVLPVHDSILIECDLADVDRVAKRAVDLMSLALRTYYPKLQPRVDVNKADMSCWNKDGRSDSLDRFLQDPDIRI